MHDEADPILSPREAARMLRVSADSVRRWVRDGTLPAVKVGAGYRIRQSDLPGRVLTPATPARGRHKSDRRVAA